MASGWVPPAVLLSAGPAGTGVLHASPACSCPCPNLSQSAGDDLASVVSAIKAQYGLQYVYAWHALGGFWGGLGLRDPEMAKYQVGLPAVHAVP